MALHVCNSQYQLSTWQGLEWPMRQVSEHAWKGLLWLGHLRWKVTA